MLVVKGTWPESLKCLLPGSLQKTLLTSAVDQDEACGICSKPSESDTETSLPGITD